MQNKTPTGIRWTFSRARSGAVRGNLPQMSIWAEYSTLDAYGRELAGKHKRGERVMTRAGRVVPRPPKGAHASLNNLIQAEAADVFAEAVARVVAVMGPGALYLGIHDELVLSVKTQDASYAASVLNREMPTVVNGIPIDGTAEILGRAWRK